MLEDSLFESQSRAQTRKPATVLLSAVIHIALVAILALIPLLQIQAIPMPKVDMSMWAPKAEPPKVIEVIQAAPLEWRACGRHHNHYGEFLVIESVGS